MKIFAKEQLSEHKYKTPQGYLVCVDAILARTGKQKYRKGDFFADAEDADVEIDVDRPEKEVFSKEAIASFENMPLVVEHPDENVTSDNWKQYSVGIVRDVHQGEYKGNKVLLGNLIIQDEQTIQEIESGEHTELSCGYDCEVLDEDNPTQTNIRGNHVALCAKGRAGIAKIQDSMPVKDGYHLQEKSSGRYVCKADNPGQTFFLSKDITSAKRYSDLNIAKKELDENGMSLSDFTIIKDSVKDVEPNEGESKEDFISRFMNSTKEAYPDRKQRLAVAYSYWDKHHAKDSAKDSVARVYLVDKLSDRRQLISMCKLRHVDAYEQSKWGEFVLKGAKNDIEDIVKCFKGNGQLKLLYIKDSVKDTSMTVTVQCYIFDGDKVLIQDKVGPAWPGLAVPGGHVQHNESCKDACIREVKEETGLDIKDLKLFGTHQYTCEEDGESIAMLYTTSTFEGQLHDSDEGSVKFMEISEVLSSDKTAVGLKPLLKKAVKASNKVKDSVKDANSYLVISKRYKPEAIKQGFNVEDDGSMIRVWGPRWELERWQKQHDMDEEISYAKIKDSVKDSNSDPSKLVKIVKIASFIKK